MSKVVFVVVFSKLLFLHDISFHVRVVDNIMYIRDFCLPLKIKKHVFFLILVAEKRKTTGPKTHDEIKTNLFTLQR